MLMPMSVLAGEHGGSAVKSEGSHGYADGKATLLEAADALSGSHPALSAKLAAMAGGKMKKEHGRGHDHKKEHGDKEHGGN